MAASSETANSPQKRVQIDKSKNSHGSHVEREDEKNQQQRDGEAAAAYDAETAKHIDEIDEAAEEVLDNIDAELKDLGGLALVSEIDLPDYMHTPDPIYGVTSPYFPTIGDRAIYLTQRAA